MFGKILIVLLMLTSLIPSMSLGGSNVRYLPAFNVLLMIAVYAIFCLKDRENREHLWAYYKGNKYILIVVALYIVTIWISSYKTGIKENIAMISGLSVVLFIMHFIFPVFIKTREDFIFIPKSLFVIGLLNAIFAAEFLVLYKKFNINYGIADVMDLSDKVNVLPSLKMPRLLGIFSNPNSLGILMAISLPAGLMLVMEAKKLTSKLMFVLCLLVLFFVLISSFSRASILSMLFIGVLFCALYFKAMLNIIKTLLLLLTLTVNFLILNGIELSFLKKLFASSTSNMRVDLWNKGIEMSRNNPFYGYGPSKVTELLGGYAAHNTFIEIATGSGVIALLLYSCYLILILLKIRHEADVNLAKYALLLVAVFSVLQLFETLIFGGMSIGNFYFLVGIISYLSVTSSAYPKLGYIRNSQV